MKATIWADAFQVLILFVGIFAIAIAGSIREGGLTNAWNKADSRGRVELFQLNPDPRVRHSLWSVAIGGIFTWTYVFVLCFKFSEAYFYFFSLRYGINQAQVQRGLSCRSLRTAKVAYWLNVPG